MPSRAETVLLTTAGAVSLLKNLVDPPPARRTMMRWMRTAKVRSVRTSTSKRGGSTYLWVRADVEKLVRKLASGGGR